MLRTVLLHFYDHFIKYVEISYKIDIHLYTNIYLYIKQLIVLVFEWKIVSLSTCHYRKALLHRPLLGLVCNILESSQEFVPSPSHHYQTSHRTLRTVAANVHICVCRGRRHKGKTVSLHFSYHHCLLYCPLSSACAPRLPLCASGKTCGPGVWCGWCSSPPGGQSCSPPCRRSRKGRQIQDRRASSQ